MHHHCLRIQRISFSNFIFFISRQHLNSYFVFLLVLSFHEVSIWDANFFSCWHQYDVHFCFLTQLFFFLVYITDQRMSYLLEECGWMAYLKENTTQKLKEAYNLLRKANKHAHAQWDIKGNHCKLVVWNFCLLFIAVLPVLFLFRYVLPGQTGFAQIRFHIHIHPVYRIAQKTSATQRIRMNK